MRAYRRMTWTDRLVIEKYYNSGASYRKVADAVGFSVGSVYREIQRGLYDHMDSNTHKIVKRYSAQVADDDAKYQATSRCGAIKLGHNYDYANTVSKRIQKGESPDSIVGDMKRKGKWTVSTPTLYRYIENGYIPNITNNNLLEKKKKKRRYHTVRAARAPRGVSIEKRPQEVSERKTFGHWEMDCVVGKSKGKGQTLLVLTERLTRYEIIFKLTARNVASVMRRVKTTLTKYPKGTVKSITVDNGSEFASAYELPVPVYYCPRS